MRTRGNKQGSIYYRKDRKCWEIQIVVDWKRSGNKMISVKKTRSGFRTKKDASAALNQILCGGFDDAENVSLQEIFDKWKAFYEYRVKKKTLDGYEEAYNYFSELHQRKIKTIRPADLQECMDKCPMGKRTHELMKVTAGLIWSYAIDLNVVSKDITKNLYIGKHQTKPRIPLEESEIKKIKERIGKDRYAEYIICLCYLGFRPGEMLELKKTQVFCQKIDDELIYYIVAGKKTEAGINRTVVIPNQILNIILDRLFVPGTDLLFPLYIFHRYKKHFIEFRPMSHNYFNNYVFKPITNKLGIKGKVPYSARHSYANKLKKATGNDKDKAELIGHTNYEFTQHQYQTSELADLKAITDSFE